MSLGIGLGEAGRFEEGAHFDLALRVVERGIERLHRLGGGFIRARHVDNPEARYDVLGAAERTPDKLRLAALKTDLCPRGGRLKA